jgi:hypothetical protein
MTARAVPGVVALLLLSTPAFSEDGESLGIAKVIRAVQDELIESEQMRKKRGVEGLFRTKQLELELNFVVSSSAEAQGGIELQVVGLFGFNLGGGGEIKQEQIQKIKLVFETIGGGPGELPARVGKSVTSPLDPKAAR